MDPPLVLNLTQDGSHATASWPEAYPGFSLETTTDLTASWEIASAPTRLDGNFRVTYPMGAAAISNQAEVPQRFFRLREDVSLLQPPRLPEGKYVIVTTGSSQTLLKNILDPNAAYANRIIGNNPSMIDATAFVDPANPNGVYDSEKGLMGPLQFHWSVRYPTIDLYTAAGISGYRSPVLSAVARSYAQEPSPADSRQAGVRFTLKVRSPTSGLITTAHFQIQIVVSSLSLSLYNDCQTQVEACSTCPCTIAAALPTSEPTDQPWVD